MMRRNPLRLSVFFALAFGFTLFRGYPAVAGDAPWKIGFAAEKITPEEPIPMSGYASRKEPFEDVTQDLWTKAMAFEDAAGNRAVLVTMDLAAIFEPWSSQVVARLKETAGLERRQILLNCSHTHAGPVIAVPDGGDAEIAARVERYLTRLEDQIVTCATKAVQSMEPATLSWGKGFAPFVMNRREFILNGVRLGNQFSGLSDRTLPVLVARKADSGDPMGVLFQVACHNTTLGGKNLSISGDFAGFAQAYFEEAHPGVPALFMAGCAGDANPYPRGTLEHAKQHGRTTADEVGRLLETEDELTPLEGPLTTVFGEVDLPFDGPISEEGARELAEGSRYQKYIGEKLLALYEAGGAPAAALPATQQAVWQFGEGLTLVALSSEVVVDYVKLLENRLGPLNLWVGAYSHVTWGYLPSKRVLKEGGYETRGTYGRDAAAGIFAPEAEDVLVNKIEAMARKAGREF